MEINVHVHFPGQTYQTILSNLEILMSDLSTLQQTVTDNTNVIESALTLISGIKTELDAAIAAAATANGDLAQLNALSATLAAEDAKLAAAVAANTPAAPVEPAPAPAPAA